MKIAIASDHAGNKLKEKLKEYLEEIGYKVVDFGTYSEGTVDYPDFALKVAKVVGNKKFKMGILICGTGIGMSIAANKVKGVRASVCWNEKTAELSRKHNDSNVLCLGARLLKWNEVKKIVDIWLNTKFKHGRHLRRVKKIDNLL